jgi:lysophospholipase L1-like esterase
MGDSIAWNFNICSYPESFWYSKQYRSRLACAAPIAAITLDEAAVKGEHTDDLLVDESNDLNNVFRVLEIDPQLITMSIIGNDLLNVEPGNNPTQAEINKAVAEVLDARQNLQEVLSVLVSELPDADIVLNTLYDNEAYDCYSGNPSDFHRTWVPIVSRILRDVAWGQIRRVPNAEVAAEFAHEDQIGGCTGFDGLICRDLFGLDNIHPRNNGYEVILEKLWEGSGGVSLGPNDVLGRSSAGGVDYGYLRRVRRLLPTTWQLLGGAAAASPEAALDDQDDGSAAAITLGAAAEELRLGGFPDWYDEIQIVRVIAGVRYRTTGVVNDDFYRMEGSISGQFRPDPGHAYTPTDWNYYTPIVGGGGPNQPPENPDYPLAKLLALPQVAAYRDASATLTKNPTLPPGATDYQWPAVTHEELAMTTIRVATAPIAATAGNDAYQVELDYAWLDLYGWEKARPEEVQELRVEYLADETLEVSFEPLTGAQRYNVYFGSLAELRSGQYDHGAQAPAVALCGGATGDAGEGRLTIDAAPAQQPTVAAYILVTAHVDDVESPAGQSSAGSEIDRSQSVCR